MKGCPLETKGELNKGMKGIHLEAGGANRRIRGSIKTQGETIEELSQPIRKQRGADWKTKENPIEE